MTPDKTTIGSTITIEKYSLTFKLKKKDKDYFSYKIDQYNGFSFFSNAKTKEKLFQDFLDAWNENETRKFNGPDERG